MDSIRSPASPAPPPSSTLDAAQRDRMSRLPARWACALVPLFGIVAACTGKDPFSPGTKLGIFHVTAKLTQSSCGPVPDPWEFDVRLNHDRSTLYWVQGGAPIQGRVDQTAHAELAAEIIQDLRPADTKARMAACSVARKDALGLTLVGADEKPTTDPALATTFAGDLVYTFAPTEGSDCSDQLTETGGDFDALPCVVRYDLTGTFKSPPP